MAQPITIPSNSFIIPVNLSSSFKTFTLPVVSTNPGRLLIFKDMFGNATNSTLRLSTIGLDRIERSNVSSMVLSNAYGAWWFQNDGLTNWFLTSAYLNTLYLAPPFGIFTPLGNGLWVKFYGPTTQGTPNTTVDATWGPLVGTASNYTSIDLRDANLPLTDRCALTASGYFSNAIATTLTVQIVIDDGGLVFSGSNYSNAVIGTSAWKDQGPTTYTGSVVVSAGVTPIQVRFYENAGGAQLTFSWQTTENPGYKTSLTGAFYYNSSNL